MRRLLLVVALLAIIFASCGKGTHVRKGYSFEDLGAAGGTVEAGNATLIVPPGAFIQDLFKASISISNAPNAPDFYVPGTAIVINGSFRNLGGATIDAAAAIIGTMKLIINYDPKNVPAGISETSLVIASMDATGNETKLESTVDTVNHQVTAQIAALGVYLVRPMDFAGKMLSYDDSLTFRAGHGVNAGATIDPAAGPWDFTGLALPEGFTYNYQQTTASSPLIADFGAATMQKEAGVSATSLLTHIPEGDFVPAVLAGQKNYYFYFTQKNDGIYLLGEFVLATPFPTGKNLPMLYSDMLGNTTYGAPIATGSVTTTAGTFNATVYKYEYLHGSVVGYTNYRWFASVNGKLAIVASITTDNADSGGVPIPDLSSSDVFDLTNYTIGQ
jgi:hypothetical protein